MKQKKLPRPVDPWRVLWPNDRGATTGDPDRHATDEAVGFALSKWEELEEELARLFAQLVGAKWADPAARAYGSINNFYAPADTLNATAEAFFTLRSIEKQSLGQIG